MEEQGMAGQGETERRRTGRAGPARILIVDDDEDVRAMLHDVLESDRRFAVAGHAQDGAEAVEAAGRLQPDAVILDQHMPGTSGLEALPALRRCAPDAVIVMHSGTPARPAWSAARRRRAPTRSSRRARARGSS
jgi:DNA-binding NarL/FixJ family response regulator